MIRLLLALSFVFSPAIHAASLSLKEAFRLSEERASEIKAALDNLEAARWNKARANSALLPEVLGQSTVNSHQILAQWGILNNQVWARRKLASATERSARLEVELSRQEIQLMVIDAFFNVLYTRYVLDVLESMNVQFKKAGDSLAKAQKYGVGEKAFLLLMQGTQQAVEAEERQKRFEWEQSLRTLEFFVGEGQVGTDRLATSFSLQSAVAEVRQLQIPHETLRVAYMKTLQDQVVINKEVGMSSHYPSLLAVASHGFGQESPPRTLLNAFSSGTKVGVLVNIPLFSGLSSVMERGEWNQRIARAEHETERFQRRLYFDMQNRKQSVLFANQEVERITPRIKEMKEFWLDAKSAYVTGVVGMQIWLQMGTTLKILESTKAEIIKKGMVEAATLQVLSDTNGFRDSESR